ncbi:hypothetical protein GE09DRAFT_1101303 [Coniochaeta sp. 2T2.1]|nr:hypothetical protein GE09DRAFT_1101303 [Coniochaeta sp. 2T2.1]
MLSGFNLGFVGRGGAIYNGSFVTTAYQLRALAMHRCRPQLSELRGRRSGRERNSAHDSSARTARFQPQVEKPPLDSNVQASKTQPHLPRPTITQNISTPGPIKVLEDRPEPTFSSAHALLPISQEMVLTLAWRSQSVQPNSRARPPARPRALLPRITTPTRARLRVTLRLLPGQASRLRVIFHTKTKAITPTPTLIPQLVPYIPQLMLLPSKRTTPPPRLPHKRLRPRRPWPTITSVVVILAQPRQGRIVIAMVGEDFPEETVAAFGMCGGGGQTLAFCAVAPLFLVAFPVA